jgi:hypothetical protein
MTDYDLTPVDSSNVKAVDYDKDGGTLVIQYKDGSTYHYHDVPSKHHEELMAARSVGGFIHANIKGVYKHSKQ